MPATDAGKTSGRRSISRPRFLSPKSKHSSISADRESINESRIDFYIVTDRQKMVKIRLDSQNFQPTWWLSPAVGTQVTHGIHLIKKLYIFLNYI